MHPVGPVDARQLPVGDVTAVVATCVPTREHDELAVRWGDQHDPSIGEATRELAEIRNLLRAKGPRYARTEPSPGGSHALSLTRDSAPVNPSERGISQGTHPLSLDRAPACHPSTLRGTEASGTACGWS